ncbi:glucose 1-dehydrogenase [Flavihumibacter rivuli]|uniref:SDR family NAD(P)-dependent oxidoreductase n=1 Tax=Flavihumibacter rivuli TaxID=2838156 RepID=UPI001BDE0DD4|nr:glucose 1-dehydrogenase [Flavihumibacter rivuli]ULQ56988.1 glucose 1-dehydrogenase [Flavihumibacter rivuli]
MFRLENKVAIITGGASGIGKAMSLLFARQGARVYVVDIDPVSASGLADEIRTGGGFGAFQTCNVADQADVQKVVAAISELEGRIDILVNNAGVAHIGNAENTSEADFDRIYSINVKGVYNFLHAALPVMKQTGGVILNTCSIAATVGLSDRFAYSMSKGAVLSMTLSVAKDYLSHKIRCNCMSPARVYTPFVEGFIAKNYPGKEQEIFEKLSKSQPIGRMGTTEEVAALALYLCSDEAGFLTGCDYPIDGGFTRLNS